MVIEKTADDASSILAREKQILLKVVRWEADIIPGIAEYSQEVINKQIEGNYDIYVGLIGMRFGSPTPKFGSGTEEEFTAAYEIYRRSPESIRVLFYFKTWEINVFNVDTEQFEKVKRFRNSLKERGVLFHDLSRETDLARLIRDHLLELVSSEWDGEGWRTNKIPFSKDAQPGLASAIIQQPLVEEAESEDSGLIEMALSVLEGLHALGAHFVAMTTLSSDFTALMNVRAQEKKIADKASNLHLVKHVVDNVANDIEKFSVHFTLQMGAFQAASGNVILGMERLVTLYDLEQTGSLEEFEKILPTFSAFIPSIEALHGSIEELKKIVLTLQHLTTSIKRAKKRLLSSLNEYSSSIIVFTERCRRVETAIKKLVEG